MNSDNLYGHEKRVHIFVFFLLTLFTTIFQLLTSNENPFTHTIVHHEDTAMFFMAGKAWANGMIPYVDFADSKGPVLFFIQLVAYLISPTNYLGVLIIFIIISSFALYYAWLTATKIINNSHIALIIVPLMAIAWFVCFRFREIRIESYAQLPYIYLFYILVYTMRESKPPKIKHGIWSGVCFASLFLMKWTLAAPAGLLIFATLILIIFNKHSFYSYILGGFIGISITILPFIIYMLYTSSLDDFLTEYFIKTSSTIPSIYSDGAEREIARIKDIMSGRSNYLFLIFIIISNSMAFLKFKHFCFVPLAILICSLFLCIYRAHNIYYLQTAGFFAISGFAYFGYLLLNRFKVLYKTSLATIVCFAFVCSLSVYAGIINVDFTHENLIGRSSKKTFVIQADSMIAALSKINGLQHPRILYFDDIDWGVGISANTLPANKYWFRQAGATPEMHLDQQNAIKTRRPDFIVYHHFIRYPDKTVFIQKFKYDKVVHSNRFNGNFNTYLFVKKEYNSTLE